MFVTHYVTNSPVRGASRHTPRMLEGLGRVETLRTGHEKARRRLACGQRERTNLASAYLARTYFETCALARAAAFLCTTPDFVALSMAEA
jgi:hypothetical protein